MRLIKLLLLLSGVAFFLPSPPDGPKGAGQAVGEAQAGAEVSPLAMISSASLAFADAAAFCQRQPGVCQTAGYVVAKLEAKAKYSVRLAYEWANEKESGETTPETGRSAAPDALEAIQADLMTTQSTAGAAMAGASTAVAKESQSTLKLEDLIPEWRGPSNPRKKQG
jgi:hypothetical protein